MAAPPRPAPKPLPRLSVVMSVYNDARYVAAAVESVLAQTMADFELLIADDGSTDGSDEILEVLAARDSRIRLFRRSNHGIVASVNFLLEQVTAPLIARMDGDDLCLPERFARQVAFLDKHPHIGALGTQFVEVDEHGRTRDANFRHATDPAELRASMAVQQPICNPSAMLRTSVVRKLGGYRAAYRYCEDYDFFLRLSRLADLANLPDVLLHYRRSGDQVSVMHNSEQATGAAIAWAAHSEVLAGRADPTDGLARLPAVEELDALFGREGASAGVRRRLVEALRYSPQALGGPEFEMIRDHVANGGHMPGAWRTVLRAVKLGMPLRAVRLSRAILSGSSRKI